MEATTALPMQGLDNGRCALTPLPHAGQVATLAVASLAEAPFEPGVRLGLCLCTCGDALLLWGASLIPGQLPEKLLKGG